MSKVWMGTSGFGYKEWKPSFYPKELPQRKFLEYYATQLNAVEIDYTFYRMPTAKTLDQWREATSTGFRMALKASRRITHWERLRLPSEALDYLLETVPRLGDRLGILLFQLPPNFKCDAERLALFLSELPDDLSYAFEFRNETWFTEEVYKLLEGHNVALVIHDADEKTTPIRLTADKTYLRLRRSKYPRNQRSGWQEKMRSWVVKGVDVYAFIKHEDNPDAPRIAMDFATGL